MNAIESGVVSTLTPGAPRSQHWSLFVMAFLGAGGLSSFRPAALTPLHRDLGFAFLQGISTNRSPGVTVVEIDSLSGLVQRNFSDVSGQVVRDREIRRTCARLVQRVAALGARAILMTSPLDRPCLDPRMDVQLANAIRSAGNVVVSRDVWSEGDDEPDETEFRFSVPSSERVLGQHWGFEDPLPAISLAARSTGHLYAPPATGPMRGELLLAGTVPDRSRHMALEALEVAFNDLLIESTEFEVTLRRGHTATRLPIGTDGMAIFNGAGVPHPSEIPAGQLLDDDDYQSRFAPLIDGRIVIVDTLVKSLDSGLPHRICVLENPLTGASLSWTSSRILATILDNIQTGRLLRSETPLVTLIVTCITGSVAALFLASAWPGNLLLLITTLSILWSTFFLCYFHGIVINIIGVTLGIGFGFFWSLLSRFLCDPWITRLGNREQGTGLSSSGHEVDPEALKALLPPRFTDVLFLQAGGMGIVYRAYDSKACQAVALKVLSPHCSRMGTARERFIGEARTLRNLSHPGLVRVLDVEDGDLYFFTMDLVEGRSIQDIIREEGACDPFRAALIGREISEVLEYVHSKNVIHRDIKASNVMLLNSDEVKVLDFGIARSTDEATVTVTGDILGTYESMAPEQAAGKRVDATADVYGLGVLLIRLITALPLRRHGLFHEFPEAELEKRQVPPPFMDLLRACLEPDPVLRPRDGRDLTARLEDVVGTFTQSRKS